MAFMLIYVTDLIFIELRMKPSVPEQVWRHTKAGMAAGILTIALLSAFHG
jgi:hypothetical protein